MVLFALVAVLLIEQVRPLPYQWLVHQPLVQLAGFLENRFNAGERQHGVVAWLFAVGGLVVLAALAFAALRAVSPVLGWLWNVLILYLTMGFRQFSHYYTDIQLALRMDDLPHARRALSEWRGLPADRLFSADIARLAIEEALAASHRHVFAVLVSFILLPGPCGPVLYRASAFLADVWGRSDDADTDSFGSFSRQAFAMIDWFPVRVTAAGFAIVGNFEDAIYCWRNQAGRWAESPLGRGIGIVLASGAGALGVCLGTPVVEGAEIDIGEVADVDFMQSAVGLVWRALLLWFSVLLLMGFAGMVGA